MAKRRTARQNLTPGPSPSYGRGEEPRADGEPVLNTTPVETEPAASEAQADDADSGPERLPQLAAWLTVERVLWGLLIFAALGLRWLDLGHFPLSDREARLGNAALAVFKVGAGLVPALPEASPGVSPFVVGLNAILFLIFGASDAVARLVPALAGVAPVVLSYRLRDRLGRWGALLAGVLFAVSPSFLYYSRMADGEIVAMAGSFAVFVGLWELMRYSDERGARAARNAVYLAAVGGAIALTAGQLAYTMALILVSFAALAGVLRRRFSMPDADSAWAALRGAPELYRNGAMTFILVFLVSATAGLLNSTGLQGVLDLAAGWLNAWVLPSNQPPSYFLQIFLAYELLPLVFGLGALMVYLARGDRLAMFLAWWFGVALTWYTLTPAKSGAAMLMILPPLILAAGRAVAGLLGTLANASSMAARVNEGAFIVLGLISCGIFGVNLSSYAQTGLQNYLAIAAIALAMLFLIGVLEAGLSGFYQLDDVEGADSPSNTSRVGWARGIVRGAAVVGTIVVVALGTLLVHSSLNLSFNEADNPRELLVDAPTTMQARGLKPMLEELSNRWEGDPSIAPVAAAMDIGPTLQWYLRDFRTVVAIGAVPNTASEPIVIVPAQGKQPGFTDYASTRIRWRWAKPDAPLDTAGILQWLLYRGIREVPPSYDIIVYVQKR